MPTVQSLKKKLRTIRSTEKLTRAMKTAYTVKFSKLSGIYGEYKKYADECIRLYESYRSDFDEMFRCADTDAPCCYVVLTSDKGMCGSFNTEILSFFGSIYDGKGLIISCGKKGTDYFEKKGKKVIRAFTFDDIPTYEQVGELFEYICSLLKNGSISSVKIVGSRYINMIKQTPVCRDLFTHGQSKVEGEEPLFVPDRETVIKNTADKIFLSLLYKRVLETTLGAQAATLVAMRSAYDTACEYSAKLETEMNRKRQSQVTADVLEIASEFTMKGDI